MIQTYFFSIRSCRRLCGFFLLLGLLLNGDSFASVQADASRITLRVRNMSLTEIFKRIESDYNYRFFFQDEQLRGTGLRSVQMKNATIESVMDRLLEGTRLAYKIDSRHIVLYTRAAEPAVSRNPDGAVTVTGCVTDASGIRLAGVTVVVAQNPSKGAITGADGTYRLDNIPSQCDLNFSFIGMKSVEVAVAGRTTVDVTLEDGSIGIDDVVVVGYGTMRKSDLTGAVVSADIEAFRESPNVSIVQSLQGSVPGLNVGQVTSAGANPSITVRGQNTFDGGNTAPLLVVDGIIYKGNLVDLNPSDIKSIDVLKDASSASVYGSRAANGVILITTMTGSNEPSKPVITYSASYSIQTPAHRLKPLNRDQFLRRVRDALWDKAYLAPDYQQYNPDFDITSAWISTANIRGFENGTDFDWWDAATQTGHIQTHNLSIRGATDRTSYFISSGLTDQLGYVMNDRYKRWTGRINLENKILSWFRVGVQSMVASGNFSGQTPTMGDIMRMSPLTVPRDADGNLIRQPMDQNVPNPFEPTQIDDLNKELNLMGNVYAVVDIPYVKGLSYRVNYSHDYRITRRYASDPNGSNYKGEASKYNATAHDWTIDNILTYDRTFNDVHSVNITLLAGREENCYENTKALSSTFSNLDLGYNNLGVGDVQKTTSSAWDESSLYYMARAHYGYKGRYLGTFTVRRDGFSGFSKKNKFGVFPSAAVAWVVSGEEFMKNKPLSIEFLKLRASYGMTGNRTLGRYSTLAQVTANPSYIFGDGNNPSVGQYISSMANEDLKWETTLGLNLGIDFSILKGRVSGNFEYYDTNTRNILYSIKIPQMTGFSSIKSNIGKIHNHGFEFSINSRNVKTKNFTWDMTLNFSLNRNRVVSILGRRNDADGDGREDDLVASSLFIDKPLGAIYHYNIQGIYQLDDDDIPAGYRPGQYRVEDRDGNGKITPDGDRLIIGYKDPSYRFSIANTFTYRNFTLRVFINSVQGGRDRYMAANTPDAGYNDAATNCNAFAYDYWTPANPHAEYAQLYYATPTVSTVYRQRSFVRLQDVSLSYQFRRELLSKIGLRNLKLYVSGKNLYTWTDWQGWDPETGQGLTLGGRPVLRSWTFGLEIGF